MRIPQGRLLMVGDQGYGDTIQFARYIGMAAERVQDVILGCSQEMGPLLENIPGVAQYCHRWNDVPGHAVHCRLSSLPHIFNTTPDAIPAKVPYLFANPERVAVWRERLDATMPSGLKRIGLAWGNGSKFRHGPVDLAFNSETKHPIARNFDKLSLVDESYWELTGELPAGRIIASAVEDKKPRPLFWSLEEGRGRVFVSIPGHYSWSFDDPLFRLLLLRGIAWSAHEPVDRFNELVWPGADVTKP